MSKKKVNKEVDSNAVLLEQIKNDPELYEKAEALASEKELDSIEDLTVKELQSIIGDTEDKPNSDNMKENAANALKEEKKHYIKDQFFKSKIGVKKSRNKPPVAIVKDAKIYNLVVGKEKFVFVKGLPLSEYQLSKFTDYQKKFYLELR